VIVTIAEDASGDNGAVNVKKGNLTVDGHEVDLDGLKISGSIATEGDFICDYITGDVIIGGNVGGDDLHTFEAKGDLAATLEICGELPDTGSVKIDGDVLDVGSNHLYITHMTGGHFECHDMELKDNYAG